MPAATDLPPHTPAPILDGGPVTNASSNNQGLVVLGLGIALGLGLAAWWLLNRHGAA
jgi:LPXTG-motif cell wall-anchored protein